jgi:hypothetical protein
MNIKVLGLLAGATLLVGSVIDARPSYGAVLANSVEEFSGVQGQDNWYYGYYNNPYGTGSFVPEFTEMTNYWTNGGSDWYSSQWSSATSQYAILWNLGGHPNGVIHGWGPPQWSVRRWISEVDGEISIMGNLAKLDTTDSDGINGHILIDGEIIWSSYISGDDGVGLDYNITALVSKGSAVEFAIDPYGTDGSDSSHFTAKISADIEQVTEPATLLGLATVAGLGVAARRKSS